MHIGIAAEPIFHIGSFAVTNTLFTSWIVMLVIVVIALVFKSKINTIPGRLQALGEIILDEFITFMASFAGSRETVRKFLPIVATLFFFVLASNWMGTLPGFESIGFHEMHNGEEIFVPLFRTVNSDLNTTLAFALIIVIGSHLIGFGTIGTKHHLGKFFVNPFKNPIGTFVGLLELIGELSRVVSLSFRLFGNIFAGSVLMLIISFLVPYIVPIPFLGLELFVGFIQALVISVLAMMFFAGATQVHTEEH